MHICKHITIGGRDGVYIIPSSRIGTGGSVGPHEEPQEATGVVPIVVTGTSNET